MTRVLHTVRISNGDSVMYVNKIREMVSLELGKEIEKDVLRIVTSIGQRKNSEFPRGVEPQTFVFHTPMLYQ